MEWRDIPGYEGLYQISEAGDILGVRRMGSKGGVLKTYRNPQNGYLQITLTKDGVQKGYHVHSLVAAAYIGPRPKGLQVLHADDDKLNNHRSNLRYDTPSANYKDAVINGGQKPRYTITECLRGHPYTPENTRWNAGRRICRACRAWRDARA